MRIPPYYQRPSWQRFFAGIIIGVILGWGFFLYQYGVIYEGLMLKLSEQEVTIQNQTRTIEELRSQQKEENEENQKNLTVQKIEIHFTNTQKLKLNQLTLFELQQQALEELTFIERKNLASVAETKDLLVRTLENKVFEVGDHRLQLEVVYVFMWTNVQIDARIVPAST
ncbi:sporulation membrane protein YtrI [Bacillus sp. FJAT-45037]|uniref:sporulation membrane protein YtrI n=1 Tax=Bacillus sp. FJAT-45037 TaxID=2011007 RepID=UPI000C23BE4D|nr:sporulation membrane protein YtrI [Bacillus sp. FJAT-45037]